ncbi:MAG: hypothetical protein AAF734_00175 [Bacteroidota bacterium]
MNTLSNLQELAYFVRNFSASTPALIHFDESYNQEDALYDHLHRFATFEEAKAFLGKEDNHKAFCDVKCRLKEKLLNHLLFLDLGKIKDARGRFKEMEALQYYQKAKALYLLSGNRREIVRLLHRALDIAVTYEHINIIIMSLEILLDYAAFEHSRAKRKYYEKLQDTYLPLLTLEKQAFRVYQQCSFALTYQSKRKREKLEDLPQHLEALKGFWAQSGLTKVYYYYYSCQIWYCELTGNFERMLLLIKGCEQNLEEGRLNKAIFPVRYNNYMKLLALSMLRRPEEGIKEIPAILAQFKPHEYNYFAIQLHHLQLRLVVKEYDIVLEEIAQIEAQPAFKNIPTVQKEEYAFIKAYAQLLSAQYKDFNLLDFQDSITLYRADKAGAHIHTWLIEILYWLRREDWETLERRIENFNRYMYNHIKGKQMHRLRALIKLLNYLVRADFHPAHAREKGRYLYNRLQDLPLVGTAYQFVELVPFDQLWLEIIQQLKQTSPHYASKREAVL